MKALIKFEPQKTLAKNVGYDAAIKFAVQIRDWPALERAIEEKIEEQSDFVAWWDQHVGVRLQSGRGEMNADRRSLISRQQAEQQTKIKQQQVSRWRQRLRDINEYKSALFGKTYQAAMAETKDVRGTQGTGENEWHTPNEYLELVRAALGEIDLDPASHPAAQERVKATRFFTQADNGLAREWSGGVWLNPPYAQPLIAEFVAKMIAEYQATRVKAAIMLTHNYTDTEWFQNAAKVASAICFTRGRVRFINLHGELAAPTQGQAFFYFGSEPERFAETFLQVGFVAVPHD
jgi:phage N-6-adenine-methyltransferase